MTHWLAAANDNCSKARSKAISTQHAGDWLKAVPASTLELRLEDESMSVAVGLRLGVNLCMPFTCSCGSQVDARGAHGLSCSRSAGRQMQHSLINSEILRAFT